MSQVRIGVLISGGGTNLQSLIDGEKRGDIPGRISLVISNKKEAYGLVRAEKAGIKNLYLDRKKFRDEDSYNKEILRILKDEGIDLVVLAGYLRVLSKDFIGAYRNKIINVHPSLIPSFCGRGYYGERVHRAVLEAGVKISGATVHFVDEGTDTGPIIIQEPVRVFSQDSISDLQARVLKVEHKILLEAVSLFCKDRLRLEGRKVYIL